MNKFWVWLLVLQSGCGTLTGGFFYGVPLKSSEPGTAVRVYRDGVLTGSVMAPCTVTLFPLTTSCARFEFVKEGYEPVSFSRGRENNDFADGGNLLLGIPTCFLGFIAGEIVDAMTGAGHSFSTKPIFAQMTKTPEQIDLEAEVPKIKSVADWHDLAKKLGIKTSMNPRAKENVISARPRQMLIGTWQMKRHSDQMWEVEQNGTRSSKVNSFEEVTSVDFKEDGNYSITSVQNGKATTANGTYIYDKGMLTLVQVGKDGGNFDPLLWQVEWYGDDDVRIEWRSEADAKGHLLKSLKTSRLFVNQRKSVAYKKDAFGCVWISQACIGSNGFQVDNSVLSPPCYHRISRKDMRSLVFDTQPNYRIEECIREKGSDFAYRFKIALDDKVGGSIASFRKIQQEFRSAIRDDYLEAFPSADKTALYVDFPDYKLVNGRIEGRAIVLTIIVNSLRYDQQTRKGVLSVRFAAGQYEDARSWIRKNIEMLVRDKNIALTTGETPPAGKYYLGGEEVKDGNVLEIEFMTE